MLSRAFAFAALFVLAACAGKKLPSPDLDKLVKPHRMEIQQGNFISQEMVSQLKAGQTKDQVRFILGSPLIADSFHGDRWDYVFWRQRANSKELEQRRLAVFFEDGKLKHVEGDVTPSLQGDASQIKTPDARPAAASPALAAPAAAPAAKPGPPAASAPAATPPAPARQTQAPPLPPVPAPVAAKPPAPPEGTKQAAAQEGPVEPPDLPEGKKRDTRTFWERLKDRMSF